MIGRTNGGSGGGASLSFKILAYATEAELLKATQVENTIGVVTTSEITSWFFSGSAEAPADPENGLLWIQTGTASNVAFNALKKNGIQLCPLSAKQYIGNSWKDLTAKSFIDGAWVDWWLGEIYEYGVFYVDHSNSVTNGTVTYGADNLLFTTNASSTAEVYEMFGPFGLDRFNKISAIFTNETSNLNSTACIFVSPNIGANRSNAAAIIEVDMDKGTKNLEVSLEVSSFSNECYVYVGTNTAGSKWTSARKVHVTSIKAEA